MLFDMVFTIMGIILGSKGCVVEYDQVTVGWWGKQGPVSAENDPLRLP